MIKTARELVDQINAAYFYAPHQIENDIDMDGVTKVTTQDRDEHRWYVMGTVVFKVGDEFFGVHGPVLLKSESMSWNDVEAKCTAFEMEQVPSVTYKHKRQTAGRGQKMQYMTWECKIVVPAGSKLPNDFDGPPRRAAMDAVSQTGIPVLACFSGWGGILTPTEEQSIDRDIASKQQKKIFKNETALEPQSPNGVGG